MGITRQQALDCFQSDDLIGIGMEADALRRTLHPEGVVTYLIDRALCATDPGMDVRIEEAISAGATGLTLHGHLPTLAAWETLLIHIRTRFPALWLHGLSATEVGLLAAASSHSIEATLTRLQAAGIDSLSGHDAGILTDAVQTATPRCSVAQWLATHRAAHTLGLPSTAAMLFGAGETLDHRIAHLEAIRQLQEDTGGFTAFLLAAFQPAATGIRGFEEATAVEYLKTLAIARLTLDNLPNLQADWPTQGVKVLQMALSFGANDAGSTFPGESLQNADGTTEEDLRRIIRGAGLRPAQRDTPYRTLYLS